MDEITIQLGHLNLNNNGTIKIIKIQALIRGYLVRKHKVLVNILDHPMITSWIKRGKYFKELELKSRKKDGKKYNEMEKKWGQLMLKKYLKKESKTNQWTTLLGEYIAKKLIERKYGEIWRPKTINGFRPDLETKDYIFEIKSRTYTTTGSAGEKILGSPFKYCDVPTLYGKPLRIIVLGYQEYEAVAKFKLFSDDRTSKKYEVLQFYKNLGIEFIKGSSLL